jgi:hypothetical protein
MALSDYLTPEQLEIMLNETYGDQQTQDFIRPNPLQFQYPFTPSGIMNTGMYDEFPPGFIFRPQGLDPSRFTGVDLESGYLDRAGSYGVANEEDVEQVDSLTGEKKFNVLDLLSNFIPGKGIGSFLAGILPKDPPEVRRVKDFYARNFGVNTAGSVASGIMKGYNPVSGGLLNMITGGKYGKPTQFGLAGAMQKRIEDILGRRAAQTDASRAQVEELRNLQLKEMQDRSDRGESLSSIGKSTFSGKGKAFEAKPSGAYTPKGFAGGR